MNELSVMHVCHLSLKNLQDLFGVQPEVFGLNLSTSIETAAWASHDLDIVVFALAPFDVPDNILYVSEPVSGCESEDSLSTKLEDYFLQIFVLSLDIVKWLKRINIDTKDFSSSSSEDVFKIAIRSSI